MAHRVFATVGAVMAALADATGDTIELQPRLPELPVAPDGGHYVFAIYEIAYRTLRIDAAAPMAALCAGYLRHGELPSGPGIAADPEWHPTGQTHAVSVSVHDAQGTPVGFLHHEDLEHRAVVPSGPPAGERVAPGGVGRQCVL